MPEFHFRNFSDIAFLQAIDKPRFLSKLLMPHAAYFSHRDVNVAALDNSDDGTRSLLTIFTHPDDQLPGELLHELHLLDSLADDDGHERIVEEAVDCGVDLSGIDNDLCAGDFVLAVYLAHPGLIRRCQEKQVCQKIKRYYEYPSADGRRLDAAQTGGAKVALEGALGPWFGARRRSELCEVFVYQDGPDARLLVTHGGIFRVAAHVTNKLKRSRLPYRPERHDSIIYDTRTGILKIHAQYHAEREIYRKTFGEIFFAGEGHFPERAPYTLESLRSNGGVITLVDGIRSVCLTEVTVEMDTDRCRLQISKGADLSAAVAGKGTLSFNRGTIVQATFSISYSSGGRPRNLSVRLPNVAEYDREKDGPVVEAFLQANGLVLPAGHDVQRDDLVAAA